MRSRKGRYVCMRAREGREGGGGGGDERESEAEIHY